MRSSFVKKLVDLAGKDPRILLLTGDLGFMVMEPFAQKFPERFINVGVAEQNMIGLASGLADGGFIPFVYSIATFATLRPYEFIRNGPVFHGLPVRIVGVGAGFEYGHNGITHYALEDIALARAQSKLVTIAPADYRQAVNALDQTWNLPGPIYYRLGKDDQNVIQGLDARFELGRAQIIGDGKKVLIVTCGNIAQEALLAKQQLEGDGISASVMIVASINPPPAEDIKNSFSRFEVIVSHEAHYINGGIGSMLAEIIAENGFGGKFLRLGVKELVPGQTGSQQYMQKAYGLSSDSLVGAVHQQLEIV